MFEQLVKETAERFNLSITSASGLMRALLSLITSERTGGAEGFVDMFRRAGLGDVITSWFGGKDGKALTPTHLESALGSNALDGLAHASGLSRAAVMSALGFLLPRVIGRLTPAGRLPSASALHSMLTGYVDRPVAAPVEPRLEPKPGRPGWPGWLPWAALAILALGALLWLRAPAATIDPQLTVSNRDGRISYSGVVRDEATRTAIVNSLRAGYGEANIEGNLRVDGNVRPFAWQGRLDELVAALRKPGVEFALNGNRINIGGWLSTAERQALGDRVRGIFGADAAIGLLGDPAADAVRAANDRALSALGTIGTSGVSTGAVVEAMNLAIINFPSGSAEIPADSTEIIRRSAEAIRRAPAGSRIEIGGHTDNTGDAARNLALSQARAESVKNALVTAGAPASALSTKGYGDTRPRARNDNEYGRFQNRRIEYAVLQ
jgi:outer membrane protein OmpA-like peptidoglycan-associated protein/uncharacterized protein YidB (DUF937 family)